MRHFKIDKGRPANLSGDQFKVCYRCQTYAPGVTEANAYSEGAYLHYNFHRQHDVGRYIPSVSRVECTYFGFDPLAVWLESTKQFRYRSLNAKRTVLFSEAMLKGKEIIHFKLSSSLKLFDLCDDYALARHNMKLDDPVLSSIDLSHSHEFGELVYQAGYDGILYPSRQGIKYAVVVFDHVEDVLAESTIVKKESALTMINAYPDACKLLDIEMIKE